MKKIIIWIKKIFSKKSPTTNENHIDFATASFLFDMESRLRHEKWEKLNKLIEMRGLND